MINFNVPKIIMNVVQYFYLFIVNILMSFNFKINILIIIIFSKLGDNIITIYKTDLTQDVVNKTK